MKLDKSRLECMIEENEDLKKRLTASESATAKAQADSLEVDELTNQIDELEERVDNLTEENRIMTSLQVGLEDPGPCVLCIGN